MNTGPRVIQVIVIREISDYILGTDRRRFGMVVIRGVSNYPSDHLFLHTRLLICQTKSGKQFDAGGIPAQMVTIHRGRYDTRS